MDDIQRRLQEIEDEMVLENGHQGRLQAPFLAEDTVCVHCAKSHELQPRETAVKPQYLVGG